MVSEKEIEAAREVLEQRVYDEGGCEAQQVPAMVREMLQAAARVRAEANAGDSVDQTTFTVSQEGFKKLLDAIENPKPPNEKLKELFRQYCAMHPAPVAWGEDIDGKIVSVRLDKSRHCTVPLYPAPQPSETVESYWKTWAAQLEGYLRAKGDYDYPPLSALTAGKPEQMPSIQQVRKR